MTRWFLLWFWAALPLWGQPSATQVLEAARAAMKAAHYCFLITVDAAGQPQARLMDAFDPEPDLAVWMGTSRQTRKVPQLRKNARATLAYYDPQGIAYVTLLGKARLVESMEERRRRWKKEWAPFYPGGPEGDTYVLLEFTPEKIEVMSFKHQIASEPLGWRPAILVRRGAEWMLEAKKP